MTFDELQQKFDDTYLLVDRGVLKLTLATVAAQYAGPNPVFLFIMAASSGGKTELLRSLEGAPHIQFMDSATTTSMLSGMKGGAKETSVLLQLQDGLFIIKDFTTILGMPDMVRDELMSQFRVIFDGSYSKAFGTGEKREWHGRVSIIAGITSARDTQMGKYSALGERFITYRMTLPDRQEVAWRAYQNIQKSNLPQKRAELATQTQEFLQQLDLNQKRINPPDEVVKHIIKLADFATSARSSVQRNYRSNKNEVLFAHDKEMPTRFTEQLLAIGHGLMMVGNQTTLTSLDEEILKKICLDSIPIMRERVLRTLAKYEQANSEAIALEAGLPTTTVTLQCEELTALGLVERSKKTSNQNIWKLKDEWREMIGDVVKYEGGEAMATETDGILSKFERVKTEDIASVFEGAEEIEEPEQGALY